MKAGDGSSDGITMANKPVRGVKAESMQMSPFEREKHKEMLAKKVHNKDPSVFLVKPDKTSKSYAWVADCFSLIYHNNVKENYVYCKICENLITYNSIHGTGSLLRHICYRKSIFSNNEANNSQSAIGSSTPVSTPKKLILSGTPRTQPALSVSLKDPISPSLLTANSKSSEISKQKKDIEDLIAKNDPSIEICAPANIKSEVWSNGNFKIIYRDGIKLDLVLCLFCNSLITYRSKTGTASLLRHSCIKKMNLQKLKAETSTDAGQDDVNMPVTEVEQIEDVDATAGSSGNASYVQYFVSEFPEEFKEEAWKLFQYLSYKDMQPPTFSNRKGFLSFCQYLINIGAEYGKVNIESVLEGRSGEALGENFLNILEKMLKPKFEEQKIALSTDYWSDPNRKTNFFTLYGHYIDDAFEMKKVNLGTVSFSAEFSVIDYKQLIVSILEKYFISDTEAEAFLAKTTTVIFDEIVSTFKTYSYINCSCLILNRIVRQLIGECNFREIVPNDVLSSDNWAHTWEFLESLVPESNSVVGELISILNPFAQALKSLSCESKPTINEVYIFRKKLEDHFKNADFTNESVRSIALALIREHFPMTNVHKIAVFLDPRFKSLKFMSHDERTNVLNMVSKMITADDTGTNVIAFNDDGEIQKNTATGSGLGTAQINDLGVDSSKYLIEYMDISEERSDIHDEVEMYVNLKFNDVYSANILEFWESRYDLPHLRQLAREILCIPATAILSEKIFSDEANLFVRRRLNMEIENIKQMLYIHENFEMLSNVL